MSLATSFTPDFFSNCVLENTSGLNISKEALRGKQYLSIYLGIPSGSAVKKKNACDAGDVGLIPGLERSPEEGNSNPLRYSCLGKSYGHRSLVGFVRGVTKNQAGLSMDASLSIQPSIYPSTCLFIYHLSIYLPIHPSTCSSSRCYYTPTHPAIH